MDNVSYNSFEKTLKKNSKEFRLNKDLIKAIEINSLDDVKSLLNSGATLHQLTGLDLHSYSSEYETPLHVATKLGHCDIIDYLLSIHCNFNASTRTKQATPLHYSTIMCVPTKAINSLLIAGANIESLDNDSASPFLWASFLNNKEAIISLVKHGCDPYLKDNLGLSGLCWASRQGNLEAVETLCELVTYTEMQLKDAINEAIDNGQESTANYLNAFANSEK